MTEAEYRRIIATIGNEYRRGLMTEDEYVDRILIVNAEFFRREG